jgi:predicted amidophosphoribosyltransferase
MLSTGFPNDEDEGLNEGPICQKCMHEMDLDGAEWYCAECHAKKEEEAVVNESFTSEEAK